MTDSLRACDARVSFRCEALGDRLPFDAQSVDLVYSHNLLECLADPGAFPREAARILRPSGQVVVGHWDWDTQLFDGADKALVRRFVAAFADWQQAWMAYAGGWMGRRLWGVFNLQASSMEGSRREHLSTPGMQYPYSDTRARRHLRVS